MNGWLCLLMGYSLRSVDGEFTARDGGSVPWGQSSRYTTGVYRADSPPGTPVRLGKKDVR